MDECDSNDDRCPTGGVCIARGRFAERKCLFSGNYHSYLIKLLVDFLLHRPRCVVNNNEYTL